MNFLAERKWFYPLIYFILIVFSMWPLYTEIAYAPRDTQDVILNILMVSTIPYRDWGWVFHITTLGVIGLSLWMPRIGGRVVATYFGANYLVVVGGLLLALNGVACILGVVGFLAGDAFLSQGVMIGGVLFLLALFLMSWAFLREKQ